MGNGWWKKDGGLGEEWFGCEGGGLRGVSMKVMRVSSKV